MYCIILCTLLADYCVVVVRLSSAKQWLQFDVGPPTLVTGLATRGRGDAEKKHWVTKFHLSYSNDSQVWKFYKETNHLHVKVCSLSCRIINIWLSSLE